MYKHYLQLQKPTPRYHNLRVHPYARFKTNKPKDVLETPAQDASCGGSGSVVGFSTNMLEAGKENVGGIGTRQECGDALPRCNLACGLRLRLRVAPHTHLTSPRFPSSRPVLSYPYALVGGLAWLSARCRYVWPRYRIPSLPSWGKAVQRGNWLACSSRGCYAHGKLSLFASVIRRPRRLL